MPIREENRNMLLLATVALCCMVVAGTVAWVDPTPEPDTSPYKQAAESRHVDVVDQAAVRVVGTPFVPNVNPRER
jgi:hypothetical protein